MWAGHRAGNISLEPPFSFEDPSRSSTHSLLIHDLWVAIIAARGSDRRLEFRLRHLTLPGPDIPLEPLELRPHGLGHSDSITRLHRPPESRRHLQQVRNALLVGGVHSRLVECQRIEEHRIALLEFELDQTGSDVVEIPRIPDGDVALFKELRVGHEARRTRRLGHVGMGDRALQGQELRGDLLGYGEAVDPVKCLMADVWHRIQLPRLITCAD